MGQIKNIKLHIVTDIKLLSIAVTMLIIITLTVLFISPVQSSSDLFDDWPWLLVRKLQKSIAVGASFKGKTIDQLQPGKYHVEAAGVLDNHSKWNLQKIQEEQEDGIITLHLGSIKAGTREAF